MPTPMTPVHEYNYILSYEAGLEALKDAPLDRDLQHKTVLSLARAGALDFAISEYQRFGLADVLDHEDIMALNGRLSKDLYIRNSGVRALGHATNAARKYEAAFNCTQGYYSGINSATMALMADMPMDVVTARVSAVQSILPAPKNLTAEDHYFIEATRAECFLLTGDRQGATESLQSAVDFDPLNFSAHATTLKQFKMIAKKTSESTDWLASFNPPRPVHFAGRLRIELSEDQLDALKITLSDTLQKYDIGFGYGALAAGYDIVLAEILLEEGAGLHVILPCPEDRFIEHSIRPFGETWVERFQSCLESATSLFVLDPDAPWPNPDINQLTGQVAMGQTILMGQSLSVDPGQILILGEEAQPSYTAKHATDWASTGHLQVMFPSDAIDIAPQLSRDINPIFQALLRTSDNDEPDRFETVLGAMQAAREFRKTRPTIQIALHIDIPGTSPDQTLQKILDQGMPQSTLLSEVFASLLAYSTGDSFDISYAGRIAGEQALRCYGVNIG